MVQRVLRLATSSCQKVATDGPTRSLSRRRCCRTNTKTYSDRHLIQRVVRDLLMVSIKTYPRVPERSSTKHRSQRLVMLCRDREFPRPKPFFCGLICITLSTVNIPRLPLFPCQPESGAYSWEISSGTVCYRLPHLHHPFLQINLDI